jgi:AbrB family looped-hinge helix DNA binding protein
MLPKEIYTSKPYLTLMEFAVARVSSKGQIVIPAALRKGIRKGDEFLLVHEDGTLFLKSMRNVAKDLRDELRFAHRIEKAWQEHDKGAFVKRPAKDFLRDLRAC